MIAKDTADLIALSFVTRIYVKYGDQATADRALDSYYHHMHWGHWPRYDENGACRRCPV